MREPGYDADGMFRNAFGEPKPNTIEQLNAAFDELNIDTTGDMSADVSETEGEGHFKGWCADIRATNFDGEEVEISTGGWKAGKADLLTALAGFDATVNET